MFEVETKIKNKFYSLSSKHVKVIGIAAFLFLLLSLTTGQLTLAKIMSVKNIFATSDESMNDGSVVKSFDELIKDAKLEVSNKSESDVENEKMIIARTQSELSMIDPTFLSGDVLGAFTDDIFPDTNEALTKENLDQIKVKTSSNNSSESAKKYSNQLYYLETESRMVDVMNAIANQDKSQLQYVSKQMQLLTTSLQSMEVPSELVTYHKYKIVSAATYATIAELMLSPNPNIELQNSAIALLFNVTSKMQEEKNNLMENRGVRL